MAISDESLSNPKAPIDRSSPLLNFIREDAPKGGEVTQVAEGVFWLRMLLPMEGLNHINLWFMRDGENWTVIDTGIGNRESKDFWKAVFKDQMNGAPVSRVIVTHLHPDHVGLAGWICEKFDAPLVMTRGEYFLCRLMAADTGHPAPPAGLQYYRKAGLSDAQLELYKARFGGFGKAITRLPHGYTRIQDGDTLSINDREWKVVVGSGHSPEHACLWCPELKICMTGDQLLPNISSNVSVWPTEPDSNPLEEWISSCHKLIKVLPDDTLICPAHGIPFYGAHARLSKLILHHERALERLLVLCAEPKLATEVYSALFRRTINDSNRIMAVGESIAHLNCLMYRGKVRRGVNDAGQLTYQTL